MDINFLDFAKWFFSNPVLVGLVSATMISLALIVSVFYYARG